MNVISLQIEIETYTSMDRMPDPGDEWDHGEWTDHLERVTATRCTAEMPDWYTPPSDEEPVPEPGTTVWVLIEVYDSGDSFGSYNKRHEERAWYLTELDAIDASDKIPIYDDYFGGHCEWIVKPVVVKDNR
jgi:hypothetical protein